MFNFELPVVSFKLFFRARQKHLKELKRAELLRRDGDGLGAKNALAPLPSF